MPISDGSNRAGVTNSTSRINVTGQRRSTTSIFVEMPMRFFLLLAAAHAVLGLLMRDIGGVATLHAMLTGAVALGLVLKRAPAPYLLLVIAYIIGSEVLWRMNAAGVPWMYSQYLVLLVAILGLTQSKGSYSVNPLPTVYALLLLPAILPMMEVVGSPTIIRKVIAFNYLPILVLGLVLTIGSRLRIEGVQLRAFLLTTALPFMGIAALAARSVFFQPITFIDFSESSFQAAAGYGPNQVSNVLSVGVFAMLVVAFNYERRVVNRIVLVALSIWFLVQIAMTLSRGGIINIAAFLVVFGLAHLRDTRVRKYMLATILGGGLLFTLWLGPELNVISGGALERRFEDREIGSRDKIMSTELQLFRDNPVTGVGLGLAQYYRARLGHTTAAHTEWTRVIAEHGIIGVLAMLVLGMYFVTVVARARSYAQKGVAAGAYVMIALSFAHQAMRTSEGVFIALVAHLITTLDPEQPGETRNGQENDA
jgi:hypothetical protein